jgi:hypothetical protein
VQLRRQLQLHLARGRHPGQLRQARSKDVSYHGHWSADFSGTNSFVTDFRYEG